MDADKRLANTKKIWGIAKCPELKLSDEELHLFVAALTGKDSIRELTLREQESVIRALLHMKDSARGSGRARTRGNPVTARQREKIQKLADSLGWDKPARVNGMCMRMFKVSSVEWLNYRQCSDLIEALKAMLARQEANQEDKGGRG